ncbi:MAG: DMT family transporter, partial [Pseudomonadota bacterium]
MTPSSGPDGGPDGAGLLDIWRAQSQVMRGVVMMCVSTVAFAAMHFAIRVVTSELDPFQVAFFRNLFGLLFLIPVIVGSGIGQMKTKRIGLHAIRGVLNIAAMLMFFTALSITPLAKVTALAFSAPIFIAVLSVLVLGERLRLRRWGAIAISFLGMLIIIRPGIVALDTGALLVLGAAAIWAVVMAIVKVLSRTESSVAIVAWMGIFLSVFSLPPAIWVWRDPSVWAWGWLIFIGFTGSIAQVTISQSLKETDPGAVMPFDFLRLIWAALLAFWFLGEVPDEYTLIGAAVIFASSLYIAHRER